VQQGLEISIIFAFSSLLPYLKEIMGSTVVIEESKLSQWYSAIVDPPIVMLFLVFLTKYT
jgi:hypothetical protein